MLPICNGWENEKPQLERSMSLDTHLDGLWTIPSAIEVGLLDRPKTKQLVGVFTPGADIYDPDNDPARNNPPGNAWDHIAMGGGELDIRYDVALDDSLFRLEPPEGYAVEIKQRDRITEKEMIDYLGIVADFNDKMFPDQAFPEPDNLLSKINRACISKPIPSPGKS